MLSTGDRFDGLVVTAVWDEYVEVQEGGRIRMITVKEAEERRARARKDAGAVSDEQQD